MIAIVDYGAGNLRSIQRALTSAGAESVITSDVEEVRSADRIVLPGVGNAAAAMNRLRSSGMADTISEQAGQGVPLLGVCLGMQLLFGDQEEGPTNGLGLMDGVVRSLPSDHKVPQMGWNQVEFRPGTPMSHLDTGYYYFVHSYIVHPSSSNVIAAETDYGVRFPSVVAHENVWGFQFHPEKSGEDGLKLVQAWVGWNP
jgi:glutamine amidotransferase